ncbi:MAG: ABC transporter substrate-binding protein [Epulopiscium sp.]|nr:ABC transporter substrate-binding protein [Candidatus Epulonipiscium sp.]
MSLKKRDEKLRLCSVIIWIILGVTGCISGTPTIKIEQNQEMLSFVDAFGDEVEVPMHPKRVVCLYHSYLELWDLAGGSVVGRVQSDQPVPEKAQQADIVGTTGTPNIEKLLVLEPDLVILSPTMNGKDEFVSLLQQQNIPYLALRYDTFDEYLKVFRLFTTITGRDDLYQKYGEEQRKEIEKLISQAPQDKKPKVLLLFVTAREVKVRFSNSTVGSMLEDLGALHVAYDAQLSQEEMQIFSMEKILERDPDFIFIQTMGKVDQVQERMKMELETHPAWKTLTAVQQEKCILLPKELYLYKPNDRYIEAYEGLARILYPEVFGE